MTTIQQTNNITPPQPQEEENQTVLVTVKFYKVETYQVEFDDYDDFKKKCPKSKMTREDWKNLVKTNQEIESDINDPDDPCDCDPDHYGWEEYIKNFDEEYISDAIENESDACK